MADITRNGGEFWDIGTGFSGNSIKVSADGSIVIVSSEYGIHILDLSIPPLSIKDIVPNKGSTIGNQFVTITGTGFTEDIVADIDGYNLIDQTILNDTTITGLTPPNTVGLKDVSVTTTDSYKTIINGYEYIESLTKKRIMMGFIN